MNLSPIVLFVYNRPWHTQRTVEALQKCELAAESDLYIFADGPQKNASEEVLNQVAEVRQYIHSIDGFQSIQIEESPYNIGCADSIIKGVSKIIDKHGDAIIMEDDIVAHPFFLRFMNDALNSFKHDKRIFCISATMENFPIPSTYIMDVFLTYRTGSWGWATWSDRWKMVNWNIHNYPIIKYPTKKQIKHFCRGGDDLWPMLNSQLRGEIDAWDIRYCYNMSLLGKLCLRPVKSFVANIGMDNSGTHCGEIQVPLLPLYDNKAYEIRIPCKISINRDITKNIQTVFRQASERVSVFKRLRRRLKRTLLKLHL